MFSRTYASIISAILFGFCCSVALAANQIPHTIPTNAPTVGAALVSRGTAPQSFDVRLSGPVRLDLRSGVNWSLVLANLFAALVGASGALFVGFLSFRGQRKSLAQSTNSLELKDIQNKLDTFYGPYMHRSDINRLLVEELRSHQRDPGSFRTLTLLLDPDWRSRLTKSDQVIVEEIVENDASLSKLMQEHAGLIDSKVMKYLARAGAHFRIMQLAFGGKLENHPKRFDRYVYPRQLDEVLRLEFDRLRERCETLKRSSTDAVGSMPALKIPAQLELPPWPCPEVTPLDADS